jgi:putative MATE family efflux protein
MSSQNTPSALGKEKIGKLLFKYALPSIIAMTASSLYNMVDSIFIGHGVGPLAIAGLAISLPLMNIAAAFGSLVGVGASTLIAIKLGQKDKDSANHILGNVVIMNSIIGTSFAFTSLFFLDSILHFFGASPDTLPYAKDYMEIILFGNIITHVYMGLNEVLRASGYPQKSMIATLTAVVINTGLDALFILVFDWGVKGAAWATIIAQIIALSFQLLHFFNEKSFIHFQRDIWGVERHIVKGMLSIGLSPFLMNLCSSLVVILFTRGLKEYGGDLAISAFGIVNRITFLFVMIVMGLNQGMQPIVGYNFGAKLYHRVTKALKYTIICAVCITSTGFIIGQFFPKMACYLFTTDEQLIEIASYGLKIILLVFPFVGFQIVTSSFFLSIGMAKKAIFLSLSRQLIFLIPCLIILPHFFAMDGVWASGPVSDMAATIIAAIMLIFQFRKFKKHPELEVTV